MKVRRRRAARILLVDDLGRVLLLRGGDPARPQAGTWWFTPGGGIEDGEAAAAAALREVREETGLQVNQAGPVVLRRHVEHEFEGQLYSQDEEFFLVRCAVFEVDTAGWTATERRVVEEHRWWSTEALRRTAETVHPEDLVLVLKRLEGAQSRG